MLNGLTKLFANVSSEVINLQCSLRYYFLCLMPDNFIHQWVSAGAQLACAPVHSPKVSGLCNNLEFLVRRLSQKVRKFIHNSNGYYVFHNLFNYYANREKNMAAEGVS